MFQWYRTENDVPATQMVNSTSYGIGRHGMEDRLDSTDKHECIWCMACVTVCLPKAVKVDRANIDSHMVASETIQ